jgi:predicted dehydrogenase
MEDVKPLRWGILAAGAIARKFVAALGESETNVAHAVASRDGARARDFAAETGVPQAFEGYELLLENPEVDAVYIATLHPFHLEWILRAVAAGKHVLCEKPLTMNLREAKLAKKKADENGRLLREAFMYRHHPQTRKVVDLLAAGAVGEVRMIETSFCINAGVRPDSRHQAKSLGGGAILDLGCYALSFARLVAGRQFGRPFAEPVDLKAVGHLDPGTRTDMWTTASLRFERDILAQVTVALRVQRDNRAVILGDAGRIVVETPWNCLGAVRVEDNDGHTVESWQSPSARNLYSYEIDAFATELRGRPPAEDDPGMRFDDTLGNMRALDWWRSEIGLVYDADEAARMG